MPWFVACCARSAGLRHPAAVAAWHLSVCLGCGWQRASLACLVAPHGAPRVVRSGRCRCSSLFSGHRGAFPHPGGLCPRLYSVATRGTQRPAENRAHCACRWPPPRRGRCARSASYPFGAPRWGCPWRVPPASVSGCVRCGGWRVWTRSLTRPVSRTVRSSTGDSAGAPGLFRVDADTSPCGSEDAGPGSRVCVRVLALLGRVGRAGLPGAFWCASPFSFGRFVFLPCLAPSGLRLPLSLSFVCPLLPPFAFFFVFFPFLCCRLLRAPFVSCFLWFPAPGALGLGAVCCLYCWPRASWLSVRSRFFGAAWSLTALCCCPPPPFVSRRCCRRSVPCVRFSFPSCVRPCCLRLSLVSGPGCPGPWRCVLFVLWASRCPALRALSPRLCVLPGRWLLPGVCCLPHFCVSRFSSLPLGAPFFFFFFPALCAPVVSGFLWFPAAGALGLGAVRCLLCWPPASWLSVHSRLFRAFRLAVGCSLVVAPPPPPFVSRGFCRCRLVLCALCCAVLRVAGCGAAPRCCALCRPVLCCCVLCCFVALVCCRCLLCRALWRCPSPWGPVPCGAVFCGVPPRCVLCAVCVLSWCRGARCGSPLCFLLCVFWDAVLYVPCPLRPVRCCSLLCWCPCVALFVWCLLLLAPGAVVRCCVLCCFLWCAVVRCWVWWPVVVCWWRVSVSVSPSGRVVCFPVVDVVCCGALLPCVVFCGAVLLRGAVLLCSAVVLWCCWCLLCPPLACRAVLCCAVGWLCCFLPGGGVHVLWCSFPRAVRSLSSPLCALLCLVVLALVPCFPVSCAVALFCCVVLCCRALLSFCGAVCACFALLWPVVRRCAVLCCAVGCLCCSLSGGGVWVLWCPSPPCRHACNNTTH